jgi:hypothetical protein
MLNGKSINHNLDILENILIGKIYFKNKKKNRRQIVIYRRLRVFILSFSKYYQPRLELAIPRGCLRGFADYFIDILSSQFYISRVSLAFAVVEYPEVSTIRKWSTFPRAIP